jgi:hypothetical protein
MLLSSDSKSTHEEVEFTAQNVSNDPSGTPALDARAELRLIRKLDRHLVPLVMLLYLACFLDR